MYPPKCTSTHTHTQINTHTYNNNKPHIDSAGIHAWSLMRGSVLLGGQFTKIFLLQRCKIFLQFLLQILKFIEWMNILTEARILQFCLCWKNLFLLQNYDIKTVSTVFWNYINPHPVKTSARVLEETCKMTRSILSKVLRLNPWIFLLPTNKFPWSGLF